MFNKKQIVEEMEAFIQSNEELIYDPTIKGALRKQQLMIETGVAKVGLIILKGLEL